MGRRSPIRLTGDELRRRLAVPGVVAGCLALTTCGVAEMSPTARVGAVTAIATPAIPASGGTAIPPSDAPSAAPTPVPTPPPVAAPAPAAPPARPTAVLPRTSLPRPTRAPAAVPVAVATPTPADHLVGPGTDVLVSPMAPYDCRGYSPPLPEDRAIIDPCAQPVTGVPLIDGHNHTNLLWNASTTWADGTVVHYGGRGWRIVQTRVVDHDITYYPMPPGGAGLQIRTCQPDGAHEWVWDLAVTS